jgi:AhpD family alkylhydroperoxidase
MAADFLRLWQVGLLQEYEALFGDGRPARVLKADEQELIMLGAYAAFGSPEDVAEHGKRALSAGASPDAIVETVLAAMISRGPRVLKTAFPFLSGIPLRAKPTSESWPGRSTLDYFTSEFGQLPEWVIQLDRFSPDSLASYAALRRQILTDGAASRKIKELLTVLLNAIEGNSSGIESHAKNAVRSGASREEILDTLLLGVRIGGIVVWVNGVNSLPDEM